MAGIIKNQLIKHLSKFARNLKPEQISVDVLKGNSKLQFIEINEDVLTELLELPSWLKIKRAYCTGVTVNVPWTRLKTCPIQIFIDEINVEVVLSSGPSAQKPPDNPFGNLADNSSYGFANKVVENMSLYINTVEINFDSDAFGGSFMLSRLSVESRSPGWAQVADLRQTRITCPTSNRTLMYKQLSWHLLRVEASAKTSKDEKRSKINAPLRLITSGGKIRIALKKNSINGSVIHARIQTILEDILWVATLPQLRSAISFASYIMSLVQESQKEQTIIPVPAGSAPRPTQSDTPGIHSSSNAFRAFYFDQTSYHLHVKKIDLHLCDDAHVSNCYPPGWDIESGAMQMTLYQVLIDIYPKTLATSDRSTWMRYSAPNAFTQWMHARIAEQFEQLKASTGDDTKKTRLERCWPQLMSFHVVVRMYDLTVQCVSDLNTKKDALKNLFTSERHIRSLPNDQYIVHFELASYFHPMTDTLPVPKMATYLQLGPFSLTFDERTLRWCLYVAHNLSSAIEDGKLNVPIDSNVETPDIRVDLIMPKVVLPLPNHISDARLPHRLVISTSTLSLTTCCFETSKKPIYRNLSDTVVKEMQLEQGKVEMTSHMNHIIQGTVPAGTERFYIRTSPVWVDTDHGPNTKGLPLIYDVSFVGALIASPRHLSIYIEPTDELIAIIDHFQFLQVTRLSAQLSTFFEMLSNDQKHFDGDTKPTSSPLVTFLAVLDKIRANVLLTTGALPSPYDSCPAITDVNNSFMERLSDVSSMTPRCETPRRNESAAQLTIPKANIPHNVSMDAFPEFPRPSSETNLDINSYIDDSASVATSVEDETTFDFEAIIDDTFGVPDVAEEALKMDDNYINDRIYKSIMAKENVFIVTVSPVTVSGSIADGNLAVNGTVENVEIANKLGVVRQETNDLLKKIETLEPPTPRVQPRFKIVEFNLKSPADTNISFLDVQVKRLNATIDDEILTHLSAFALDEQPTDNKLRLTVNVSDSAISIVDRKQKKPMKIKVTAVTIEKEED